ncbi:unnamed protein product [Camellia sinensis]
MSDMFPTMSYSSSFSANCVRYGLYIHYFLLLLLLSAQAVVGGHIVKYLSGYDGELPFKLETGYIRVNESELFYYFIESQGNPQEDPIFLWLTGGPGCSSFCGLAYEIVWFDEHPQYLAIQLFVGGDSYSGITVPLVTKKIVDGNKDGVKPFMNLKGYLLGSPRTDSVIDENSKVVFAHRMALISDEIYENAKKGCNETYLNVDPANTACIVALGNIKTCIKDLFHNDILEPKCVFATPDPGEEPAARRSLEEVGSVLNWERCNKSLSYTKDILTVVPVHEELKELGLEVLVETGDRDMVVPFVGTVKWIKSLNLTVVNDWRPWFVDGQVAGYTVKYSEHGYRLTYATVKGAGHTAPEYYRRECYYMFDKWIHYYPI